MATAARKAGCVLDDLFSDVVNFNSRGLIGNKIPFSFYNNCAAAAEKSADSDKLGQNPIRSVADGFNRSSLGVVAYQHKALA